MAACMFIDVCEFVVNLARFCVLFLSFSDIYDQIFKLEMIDRAFIYTTVCALRVHQWKLRQIAIFCQKISCQKF